MARTSKTAAQQAALDQLRAQKEIDAQTQAIDHEADFVRQAIDSLPSGKRALIAFFASVSASVGTVYSIQLLISYAVAGVLALSGSIMLSTVISILGLLISFASAYYAGSVVFTAIVSGSIDAKFGAVKNKVTGLFARRPISVAA